MQARVVISHVRPGEQEEAMRHVEESLAVNQQEEGFKSQLFLIAPESGKAISITLWEEEAHEQATQPAFQQRVDKAAHMIPEGSLTPEVYEVRLLHPAP